MLLIKTIEKPMAINISRKGFFSAINIDDKIDSIAFYPSTGRVVLWVLLIILGIIMMFFVLVNNVLENIELLFIIVILVLLIYGFKTLSKVEPILLIRFPENDYFLKRGVFGRKIIHGNLTEVADIKIDVETRAAETDYIEVYCLSLKWKDGKQFVIGEFYDGNNAETVAKELRRRLKIGIRRGEGG